MVLHCPLCCDQPFEDQQSLFFHLRGLRNNLFCPICSQRFSSLELLVSHLSRKCHGPQSPSEAKRRCLTNFSSSDKSDIEDDIIKTENKGSETSVKLPGRLLKNISVSIKNPVEKTPQKQTIGVNLSNPIVLAVDPKNPSITNGVPLHSVVLESTNLETTMKITGNDKEPGSTSFSTTTNAKGITPTLSDVTVKQVLTNGSSTSVNTTTKLNNKRKRNGNYDGEDRGGGSTNIDSSTHLDTPLNKTAATAVTTNSEKLIHTGSSIIEQEALQYLQEVPKRKRGRPKKLKNEQISNGAVKNDVTKSLSSSTISGDKTIKNSSMPSHDSDDDNGHFEESTDQYESQPVDDPTASKTQTSVPNTVNTTEPSKNKEDTKTAEDEEEYTCSACDTRFTSIYEHIREFHNGEEVVVEVPEEEIKEDLKAYQNESDVSVQKNNFPSSNDKTPSKAKADELVVEATNSTAVPTEEVQIDKEADNDQERPISSKNSFNARFQTHIPWPKDLNKHYAKQVNKLHKSGEWLRTRGSKRSYFHYVTDKNKMVRLLSEMKDNSMLHPDFKVQIQELFENPKINVIAITNKPNTPFFTYKQVDLNKPIPMFVIVRQPSEPDSLLGGIASYVLANPCRDVSSSHVAEDTKVIAVMKVFLGSDQILTVENIVFKNKPAVEGMVPVLEDIVQPDIPMLDGGKKLKWQCVKCMSTTWKFPLSKDSHVCNGCTICHKPFATYIALKKHMFIHRKNVSNYCEKCHVAFISSKVMETHKAEHENHNLCPLCNLFVPLHQQESHKQLHTRLPVNQFPCSVCHKMFASGDEVKAHETKTCGRLVAKYNCSSCDKKFFSLTALSYHTSDHKNINIKFPCRFCQKTFIKEKEQCPRKAGKRKPSSYLQKIWHERIHTRDRPFLCSACPKRFRSLDHQTMHNNQAHCSSRHKDVPIYMCNICDKLFQNAQKLKIHKRELHLLQQPA